MRVPRYKLPIAAIDSIIIDSSVILSSDTKRQAYQYQATINRLPKRPAKVLKMVKDLSTTLSIGIKLYLSPNVSHDTEQLSELLNVLSARFDIWPTIVQETAMASNGTRLPMVVTNDQKTAYRAYSAGCVVMDYKDHIDYRKVADHYRIVSYDMFHRLVAKRCTALARV